jgi:hypothetical protein
MRSNTKTIAKPEALLEVHIFEKEADCFPSSFCVKLHLASALQVSSACRLMPRQTSKTSACKHQKRFFSAGLRRNAS